MKKRIGLSAVVLLALLSASPVQAIDWFDSLFGPGGGHPDVDPTLSTTGNETVMGPGGGGGNPGVDPE